MTRLALYASLFVLAAVAALAYFGSAPGTAPIHSGSVQVAGSETMRAVVAACAEDFMARNPKADVIVKGGGSGDGVAALLHGLVDIGMTSRALTERERDYARSRKIELSVVELALDGITIAVNRDNPIGEISLEQLQGIFSGKLRNWRELGGADASISVFVRAPGSGTASLFEDRVLQREPYAASAHRLPTNEAIFAEVGKQPNAIGYGSLGALRGAGPRIKILALRADGGAQPVSPVPDAVRARAYPLTRALYLGLSGNAAGTPKEFVDFCTGPNGRLLLQKAGYVAIDGPTK
jgi:phosphate transport system substrate-binding protein